MWGFIRQYPLKYWKYYLSGIGLLLITTYVTTLIPIQIKKAVNYFAMDWTGQVSAALMHHVWVILVLAAVLAVSRSLSRTLVFFPGRFVEYDIRNDLFKHLMGLSRSFYRHQQVGDLMSRVVNDIRNIRLMVALGFLHVVNTVFIFSFVFYQMFSIHWKLALLVLSPIPVSLVIVKYFATKLYEYIAKTQKGLGQLTHFIVESLSNIQLIQSYWVYDGVLASFSEENMRYDANNVQLAKIRSQMFPFIGIMGSIGHVILFIVGGYIIIQGNMSIGDFVAFSAYLLLLAWPTASLAWIVSIFQKGVISYDRIQGIFREEPDIVSHEKTRFDLKMSAPPRIAVKSLSFEHDAKKVLDDVSFCIEPGQSLGVFGAIGSGKSVLASILARLEAIPGGLYDINGVDVVDWSVEELRSHISYVPQKPFLFSDTIENNIAYSHQSLEAPSSDRGTQFAQISAIDYEIHEFPDAEQTMIGEKGIILSRRWIIKLNNS